MHPTFAFFNFVASNFDRIDANKCHSAGLGQASLECKKKVGQIEIAPYPTLLLTLLQHLGWQLVALCLVVTVSSK